MSAPFKKRALLVALTLAFVSMASAADQATEPGKSDKVVPLDAVNVVYSSTKTVTAAVDIPQSVSAVTPERMHAYGVQGLDESVRYLAGVVSGGYGTDPRSDWILVRGYDPARYLDGLPLPSGTWTSDSRVEPYGLERIEVNKGPSSAMYGQLPPGGMIDMTSKRPSLEAPHEVEATVGTFDQRQLAADVGGQLDHDGNVFYRLVGLGREGDASLKHSKDNRYYFAPSLSWQMDDDTKLTILGRWHQTYSNGVGGFLPSIGTLYPNPNGRIPDDTNPGEPGYDKYRKKDRSIGWELTHRINDVWSVKQDLRVQYASVDHRAIGSLGFEPGSLTRIARYNFPILDKTHLFAVDNQAQAKFATGEAQHTVLMGVDYQRNHDDYRSGYGGAPSLDIYNPVYGAALPDVPYTSRTITTLKQLGAYVQDQVDIGKWGIVASGRKDWVRNDIDYPFTDSGREQRDNAFSGRLGVNYRTDIGLVPYVAYSHSFKTIVGQTFAGKAFEPTTGDQVEAGMKYQTADGRTLISAAVYQLTQRNALTVDPDHLFQSLQQGKTRTRGAEIEANVAVTDNFSMTAAYAYTDAKVVEANDDSLGKQVALVPKRQASVSADYAMHGGALDGLGFGGGIRYIGERYGDAPNLWRTGGYVLYDANVHYTKDSWTFQVTAANLFDRQYVSTCNSGIWCYYGYPRTMTASARFRW
ncbi:iron complex outermembrane receptor protein [Luteibacter sp. Sphag1AF]|uniref:TonB-dependent siderophore receptor n=1 Tax=Luteibacter sp. Sphag1AF TaxID=2587031 RepID=UPI001622A81A|nr:TonB-dependent siderophore receptor [Luteibacter sp. Sphag1AF]MBB3227828.1 iron complex outermembrane receptor protein [Luteibacter sp. Sphag1AF]